MTSTTQSIPGGAGESFVRLEEDVGLSKCIEMNWIGVEDEVL
jgi:hypothetical protein